MKRTLVSLLMMAMPALAEPATPTIVVDQFGYLPDAPKTAVLRHPVIGFDAPGAYTPSPRVELRDAATDATVLTIEPVAWHDGATDPASGDRTWSVNFSELKAPGTYVVVDPAHDARSPPFRVAADVYRPVLIQATRMLFYQRAGYPKQPPYVDPRWRDGPSFLGHGQDTQARLYSAPDDPATERDLHGGWYDAGDYNRYTAWAGQYVVDLLSAYRENPGAWTDDFNIPESGNGVPDLLDEVHWELDWLTRMQNPDGSLLSVLGVAHATPPSAATGPSRYGPANTIGTRAAAAAFACAAQVYAAFPLYAADAADYRVRAERAWTWAEANPRTLFRNNDESFHSEGLAAGQQEGTDADRDALRLIAAVHLFSLTNNPAYRAAVDTMANGPIGSTVDPLKPAADALAAYAALPNATPETVSRVRDALNQKVDAARRALGDDPYGAPLPAYWWGSNGVKARAGLALLLGARPDPGGAEAYLHYLHGLNPLGEVYLSSMGAFGATHSASRFYHGWFGRASLPGSTDRGDPPPGYLVGGPNPNYHWTPRCPEVSPKCGTAELSPPTGQPPAKSYRDFDDGWPLDSWEITEPSISYQAAYLRLLSKYVP